ncbi:MAG: ComEC/Rec2 family competence protein [Candidatus Fimenecus sp.]
MANHAHTKNKKVRGIQIAVLAICVLFAVLVTYAPKLGLPTFGDLFRESGINQAVDAKDYAFSVHYIDVGQADCSLIICGEDTVLIDAGEVDSYDAIHTYLTSQNVSEIDYLILTHAHSDHIGSADEILKNYTVQNVIMPKYTEENMPTSKTYEDLLYALADSGAKVIAAKPGNSYSLSECSFTVLAPNKDYEELNNSSVVVRFIYGNTAFLFQGDAEKKSEQDILDAGFPVSADVIKLGHHGSNTSSSAGYLAAVQPTLAVISCGEKNAYGHPSEKILTRLDELKIDYRRTDRNGNIVVTSDGNTVSVETEK